jgi:hypothetical protein
MPYWIHVRSFYVNTPACVRSFILDVISINIALSLYGGNSGPSIPRRTLLTRHTRCNP